MMRNFTPAGFVSLLLFSILIGCSSNPEEMSDVEIVELEEYETVVSFEENILSTSTLLKFDGESSLFVYDIAESKVVELDTEGNQINEFGRQGRGPGEFLFINNIYSIENELYLIDTGRFLIHQYNRNGTHISSLDYGDLGYMTNTPHPPVQTHLVSAQDLTHQPHVTLNKDLLLSPFLANEAEDVLFYQVNWEGEVLSTMGSVPEGSSFTMSEEYSNSISNREVPALEKPNAFPVNDLSNLDEIFMIYSAIPKIAKYNSDGERLWERDITGLAEVDSVSNSIFGMMENLGPGNRMMFNKYITGTSTSNGDLYLGINSNPIMSANSNSMVKSSLWIHQFNSSGELTRRYKIESELNIPPIFDVDPENRQIFVATEEAEIRAYSF